MRAVGLGRHHDAGGLLVEPVDDTRPLDAANARQAVAAMEDQRIDQGASPVARAGVNDQTGRLVDDDEFGVLVENVERDIFAGRFGGFGLGKLDRDAVACRNLALGLGDRRTAHSHGALPDKHLDAAARIIAAKLLRQPLVESRACGLRLSFEDYQSFVCFAIRIAHKTGYPE